MDATSGEVAAAGSAASKSAALFNPYVDGEKMRRGRKPRAGEKASGDVLATKTLEMPQKFRDLLWKAAWESQQAFIEVTNIDVATFETEASWEEQCKNQDWLKFLRTVSPSSVVVCKQKLVKDLACLPMRPKVLSLSTCKPSCLFGSG